MPVKLFGRTNRVLSRHRIGDKQNLDGMRLALYRDELFHQLIVDVQTSGRVDQQRIEACLLRVLLGLAHERQGIVAFGIFKDLLTGRFRDNFQLLARCWPVNVD